MVANTAVDGVARIAEVEAWTPGTTAPTSNINWLVADQLGTPRMVFDKTGALATVKRHDYLPFGEEIFAGTRGRTSESSPRPPNQASLVVAMGCDSASLSGVFNGAGAFVGVNGGADHASSTYGLNAAVIKTVDVLVNANGDLGPGMVMTE